jgi:hypothetical protein
VEVLGLSHLSRAATLQNIHQVDGIFPSCSRFIHNSYQPVVLFEAPYLQAM